MSQVVSQALLNTIRANQQQLLRTAARGWLYALYIDHLYLDDSDFTDNLSLVDLPPHKPPHKGLADEPVENQSTACTLDNLVTLISTTDYPPSAVQNFIRKVEHSLSFDSLHTLPTGNRSDITAALGSQDYEVIIFGAGPVGLTLANMLIMRRPKTKILVLETRIVEPGRKRPYGRQWLVHLPKNIFAGMIDTRVEYALQACGDETHLGADIATIESLLLASCKARGVNFIFDDIDPIDVVQSCLDAIVFDATGNKLQEVKSPRVNKGLPSRISSAEPRLNSGHSGHGVTHQRHGRATIELKKEFGHIVPHEEENVLRYGMFKITRIESTLFQKIYDFAIGKNNRNQFYVWPGHLAAPRNQMLVIVNLHPSLVSRYSQVVPSTGLTISEAIGNLSRIGVDDLEARLEHKNTLSLFSLIKAESVGSPTVERPFIWSPYMKDIWSYDWTIANRNVVPIGDSLLNGHPKVGNGLGFHIKFCQSVVRTLLKVE